MPVLEPTTANLIQELRSARLESDRLFSILKREAIYERPIAERHRVIFYIGHLDAFDYIQICRESLGMRSPEPELDALFQAGIDPDTAHLPADKPSDWPTLERVKVYVDHCRKSVDKNLEHASEDAICIAIEHRQMHLETLAYMFHNFAHEMKHIPGRRLESEPFSNTEIQNEWRDIAEGEAILGKPHDGSFGWDNEYDEVRSSVPAFRMQRYSVSNGEYLRFVKDGARLPHFWREFGGSLRYAGMFEQIPLPLDWPVYVTHLEAEAYAKWLGKSLPTEQQFHRAAYGDGSLGSRQYPWGSGPPTHTRGNFDFKRWDPEPVHATPAGDSAWGVSQLVGNGWEWTSTPFGPFPGFNPRATYPGYSANFFDGEHYVLKGGSSRTAARLLRRSFRNWFRRDYPYVYATFRCVEN
jgi:gamma-glutamyl hercynylcysteine S-oxide synthase